ncbi:MAG: flavodoxin family protein [Brevinematales bacterium]|jgi:multimeric flavodoxin WrbA
MKLLAINSSHRGDKGFTSFLIGKLFKGASDAGADCRVVTLAGMKITPCKSCEACQMGSHKFRCIYDSKDDVREIFNNMAQADIIVFASPVYVFGMTGLMKTLLDRLHATGDSNDIKLSKSGLIFHHIEPSICSKPFVLLACCDNMENETPKNIKSYFKTYSKFMDAKQVGTLVRKTCKLAGSGKDSGKERAFPKIYNVYEAYYQAGKELATLGKIKGGTLRKANKNILPVPGIVLKLLMNFRFFRARIFEIIGNK